MEKQSARELPCHSPPGCRVHSHQNCWITSPTFYTTQKTRSSVVASSPNHGSRGFGSTSSLISSSPARRTCNHGKPHFRTLPPLPRVTLGSCLSSVPRWSCPQMQKKRVGSQLLLALNTSKWTPAKRTTWTGRLTFLFHSMDSPLPLNLST